MPAALRARAYRGDVTAHVDVLVVGAGPTGLALAAELAACGVVPRLVDRGTGPVAESRALAIQPRTLEVLERFGVSERLVREGTAAREIRLYTRGRVRSAPLGDLGLRDTAYPYLLLLAQAETERALADHLATAGVRVERGVEVVRVRPAPGGAAVTLRHGDGRYEEVTARFVVGCDGARSTVRREAGVPFSGGAYPRTLLLADLEADGLDPGGVGVVHAFLAADGLMALLPLARPASWRMVATRPPHAPSAPTTPATLADLQAVADHYTGGRVRLHDPVWMTSLRLHHRLADGYRRGPVLLAGDAAHIHSPAGAQGMNTGVQDAVNLGWKLALTVRGLAPPELLDTYERERAPVGGRVIAFTDRLFAFGTSTAGVPRLVRGTVLPVVAPLALRPRALRRRVFRTLSELAVRYRSSPLSVDGADAPRRGPRAGDRLPDATVARDGRPVRLHTAAAEATWALLLCGPLKAWPHVARVLAPYGDLVRRFHLTAERAPGVLHDPRGRARARLGVRGAHPAHVLVRPDGHIGYRAGGTDLTGLEAYLRRWVRPPARVPADGTVA